MNVRKVDLNTICGGGLPELFERELEEVMSNIADVNTDPKKPRRISISVDVQPSPDRRTCTLSLGITSKVVSVGKISGTLYIAKEGEKCAGYTSDIRQQDIFDTERAGAASKEGEGAKPYILKKEA